MDKDGIDSNELMEEGTNFSPHNKVKKTGEQKTASQASRPYMKMVRAKAQQQQQFRSREQRKKYRKSVHQNAFFSQFQRKNILVDIPDGRSQRVIIKARVVPSTYATLAAFKQHLRYIERDGVSVDGDKAKMYSLKEDQVDKRVFMEKTLKDQRHFRFIISPEFTDKLDLTQFTRDLMQQMSKDLRTSLDWVAVNHYNTDNPHIHVVLRGVDDADKPLVIRPYYLSFGMRYRAQEIATLELGWRNELDVQHAIVKEISQERFTSIDKEILGHLYKDTLHLGVLEGQKDEAFRRRIWVGRLKTLETMGLAEPIASQQWRLHAKLKHTLQQYSIRKDIIKRMHAAMGKQDMNFTITDRTSPLKGHVIGRIQGVGMVDELQDRYYVAVESVCGKNHYIELTATKHTGKLAAGNVVEISMISKRDRQGHQHKSTAKALTYNVLSSGSLAELSKCKGATWLDVILADKEKMQGLAYKGFGAECRSLLVSRKEFLIKENLLQKKAGKYVVPKSLPHILEQKEITKYIAQQKSQHFRVNKRLTKQETFQGKVMPPVVLNSGTYVCVENSKKHFVLAPWKEVYHQYLGSQVKLIAFSSQKKGIQPYIRLVSVLQHDLIPKGKG